MNFIYADPNKIKVEIPDLNKSFQQGAELNSFVQERQQQGILSQLLAQNTGADGNVNLVNALSSVQSNPKQAYQPEMINTLAGLIKQSEAAKLKAQNDALAFDADLNKTYAETGKSKQEGLNKGLESSEKKFGAINQVFQAAALTGSKNNVLLGLNAAHQAGLIDADTFNQQRQIVDVMSPEDIKSFASGISFSNAKDPASLLYQSADNAANNATTQRGQDINQVVSNNRLNYDYQNLNAQNQRFYDGLENSNNQAQLNREQQWQIQTGKGTLVTGADGKSYIQAYDGSITPATDTEGNHISKNTKSTVELRKEGERLQKMETVLKQAEDLIEGSTHSGLGSATDATAGFFGKSTTGADKLAALKSLQSALIMMMPRMEGPQSDKDVQLYREMAGRLGEPIPVSQRREAIKAIRDLNEKYAEIQGISQNRNQSPAVNGKFYSLKDVNQIAKEYGISSKDAVDKIKQAGGVVK